MITDHYRIGKHKYYFKVLEEGRRPPHARHADPWPPIGQWTCEKYPSMCSTGYHLTTLRGLPRWAPGLFDLNFAIPDIYVAEIDLGTPGVSVRMTGTTRSVFHVLASSANFLCPSHCGGRCWSYSHLCTHTERDTRTGIRPYDSLPTTGA